MLLDLRVTFFAVAVRLRRWSVGLSPKTLATITDIGACGGAPYQFGNIALYAEAASADFTSVQITTP